MSDDGPKFFQWVAQCCVLLGWPVEDGWKLLPEADPAWFWCFDDGMSPEAAVAKYKAKIAGVH